MNSRRRKYPLTETQKHILKSLYDGKDTFEGCVGGTQEAGWKRALHSLWDKGFYCYIVGGLTPEGLDECARLFGEPKETNDAS